MAKFKELNIELKDNQKLKLGSAEIWFDGNKLVIDGDVTITGSVSGSSMSRCHAYLSSLQLIPTGSSYTQVQLDEVSFDALGEFDTVNHKFVAAEEGYYITTISLEFQGIDDGKYATINIRVNGAVHATYQDRMGGNTTLRCNTTKLLHLMKDDEVTLYCRHNNPAAMNAGPSHVDTFLSIHRLS